MSARIGAASPENKMDRNTPDHMMYENKNSAHFAIILNCSEQILMMSKVLRILVLRDLGCFDSWTSTTMASRFNPIRQGGMMAPQKCF